LVHQTHHLVTVPIEFRRQAGIATGCVAC
jgi:hypothetical protein